MVKIYRMTDKIPVKLGEVTFWVSPLSYEHRSKITALTQRMSGKDHEVAKEAATLAIKYGLKELEGVEDSQGNPYELAFDSSGGLSDDCLSEVIQLDGIPDLTKLCLRWAITEIRDPKDFREKFEAKMRAAVTDGTLSEKDFEKQMNLYPLDGVTVDFSAIKGVKKKLPSQASG